MKLTYISKPAYSVFNSIYTFPLISIIVVVVLLIYFPLVAMLVTTGIILLMIMRSYKWMREIAVFLKENYEVATPIDIPRFKLIETMSYLILIIGIIFTLQKVTDPYGGNSELEVFLQVLSYLLPTYHCYKTARILKEVETGETSSFIKVFPEFLGFYFSIIGIWFLQKRVNNIYEDIQNEDLPPVLN